MSDILAAADRELAETFMAMAVEEARKGEGGTRPNPCVGVVIVKDGRVVGRGFHVKAGGPHAEVFALREAGENARGADLYSTLEPCDHTGKTPPCTRAIIQAGVSRVFVGSTDVNPLVSGKGCQRLRDSGIQVFTDVLAEECARLNAPFFKFVTTRRPFVTLKVAATADGMIATGRGHSKWVTCRDSLERVHDLRHRVDAVLVGAGTVRADDPELTARPGGVPSERQPLRVVLSSDLSTLPPESRLFETASPKAPVLVITSSTDEDAARALEGKGVQVAKVGGTGSGFVDLDQALRVLGSRDVMHLMVEGGAEIFGAFVSRRLFDRVLLFQAPKVLGPGISWARLPPPASMGEALPLRLDRMERSGVDALLTYLPALPE